MFGLFSGRSYMVLNDETVLDLRTPIGEACYVVLDTELTGLDVKKDSIVSVGAVKMTGGQIELGKTFDTFVNPETSFSPASVLVHGITPSDVEDKPAIRSVLQELKKFCAGCVVAGHFVSLDLAVLSRESRQHRGDQFDVPAIDTWRIHTWIRSRGTGAARQLSERGNQDLLSLCREYGIPEEKAHDALCDALVTAQLLQRFLRLLPGLGVRTLEDLLAIARP